MALRLDDFFDENDDARKKEQREKVELREDDAGSAELADEDDFEDDFITSDSQRRRRRCLRIGLWAVAVLVVCVALRLLFFSPAASEGSMRGYVVSFEKTGFMFDSYEGVFVLDSPSDTASVRFSTTDQQVGRRVFQAMHTDSVIVLRYKRYNKSLPWRGSSNIVVTGASSVSPTPVSVPKPPVSRD